MNSVWKQTGVKPKELDELVELPEVFSYLWADFLRLNSNRTSNGFGINPISLLDIVLYYQLYKIDVQPWEVEVLQYFDNTVMNFYSKKAEAEQNKNKHKSK